MGGISTALNHPGVVHVPASMPGHEPGRRRRTYTPARTHHAGGGLMDARRTIPGGALATAASGRVDDRRPRAHAQGQRGVEGEERVHASDGVPEPDTPSALTQQPPDRIATPQSVDATSRVMSRFRFFFFKNHRRDPGLVAKAATSARGHRRGAKGERRDGEPANVGASY